jgi:hypothetical protein
LIYLLKLTCGTPADTRSQFTRLTLKHRRRWDRISMSCSWRSRRRSGGSRQTRPPRKLRQHRQAGPVAEADERTAKSCGMQVNSDRIEIAGNVVIEVCGDSIRERMADQNVWIWVNGDLRTEADDFKRYRQRIAIDRRFPAIPSDGVATSTETPCDGKFGYTCSEIDRESQRLGNRSKPLGTVNSSEFFENSFQSSSKICHQSWIQDW